MSGLPSGWVRVTLDEIAEVQGGIQKQQKRRPVENKFPFLRVANVASGALDLREVHEIELFEGELERFVLRPGDLLVVEGNGSVSQLGRAARWNGEIEDCVHQNHLIRVRPGPAISARFLELLWNSPVVSEQLRSVAASTSGLHTLSTAKLKRVSILLPPLEEQRRIVAVLEEQLSRLGAAVEAVELSRTRSRQLWSSILHQMTEGALSRKVRRPVTWERTDAVAAVQGGIQKQARRRPVENKFPFLRVANVPRGRLALDDVHEIELFKDELQRYRLEIGDLLVVEGNGSPDQIGRAASWRGEIKDCVHQNHLIRVRPGARLRAEFLELAWNSPKVAQQLKRAASSTSGLHTLSTAKVKSVQIPVPSLEEQDALLEVVQEWRIRQLRAEAVQQVALARANALRRSLLADAFSGTLVPQNPSDELANDLLVRIRAEREAAGATKSQRRGPRRTPVQRKRTPDTTPSAPDAPPPPSADAPSLATATQPTLDLEIPS